jgi:hypothetical protein
MFVRVPEQPPEVWQRFRLPDEGFEFAGEGGLYRARVVAGGERTLSLFHTLIGHLAPSVSLRLHDVRSHVPEAPRVEAPRVEAPRVAEADEEDALAAIGSWAGDRLDRDKVRIAVDGARGVLAREGGVEIAVFDDEDQVTLGPNVDVFVFSRTARWYPLLRGLGLGTYQAIPHRSWRLRPSEFPPSAAVRRTIRDIARRFGAEPV